MSQRSIDQDREIQGHNRVYRNNPKPHRKQEGETQGLNWVEEGNTELLTVPQRDTEKGKAT